MRDTPEYRSHRRRRLILRICQVALGVTVALLLYISDRTQREHHELELDLHQQVAAREIRKLVRTTVDSALWGSRANLSPLFVKMDSVYAQLVELFRQQPAELKANKARLDRLALAIDRLRAYELASTNVRDSVVVASRSATGILNEIVDDQSAQETKLFDDESRTRLYFGSAAMFVGVLAIGLYAFSRYMVSERALQDKAQRELDEQLTKVSERSAHLGAVLRSIGHPIFAVDPHGTLIFWNDAFERFFAELTGSPPEKRALEPAALDPRIATLVRGIAAATQSHLRPQLHFSKLRRDYEIETSSIDHGHSGGSVVFLGDITERLQNENVMMQAKNQAEEMNRMKTAFLSNMSHELRTPLTAILGFSELLAVDAPNDDIRGYAAAIERSGKRLSETLAGLMRLVELEGDIRLKFERVDVAGVLKRIVDDLKPFADSHHNQIDLRVPATALETTTDRTGLTTILEAVIHNAIKFSHSSTVSITLGRDGSGFAMIRVRDHGIGISPDYSPRAFQLFSQESEGIGRSFEGLGIGLAIAKRYANLMHAELVIQPVKDDGTLVTLRVPAEMPTQNPHVSHTGTAKPRMHVERPTLLVVDDSLEISELIAKQLHADYDVLTAKDGPDALQIANERVIDAVLLDLDLGEGPTGFDVLHSLRERPKYRSVPVIAVTAAATSRDHALVDEEGFDDYVSKPYRVNDLKTVLERQGVVAG